MLIVEDAFLVGLQLKRDVESLGFEVLGPAPRADAAISLLDHDRLACAVLDVNLGEGDSTSVAKALRQRGVPFFFITGYETVDVEEFEDPIVLHKPVGPQQVRAAIIRLAPELIRE